MEIMISFMKKCPTKQLPSFFFLEPVSAAVDFLGVLLLYSKSLNLQPKSSEVHVPSVNDLKCAFLEMM